MTLPADKKPFAIAKNDGIEQAEAAMLNMEQVECPVSHFFGPNLYVREVFVPAGSMVITHPHKKEHLNILLKGKGLLTIDGITKEIQAPFMFVGKKGRKVGMALEDVVWQNIFATSETDIEKLEDMLFDKSETFTEFHKDCLEIERVMSGENKQSYFDAIKEVGVTEDQVSDLFDSKSEALDFTYGSQLVSVRKSGIHGYGLFLSVPVKSGSIVCAAMMGGIITKSGKNINHSASPNCKVSKGNNGDIFLVATEDISGCSGGDYGTEITVDYVDFIPLLREGSKLCLQ